jgi:hypothetical protein
MKTILLALTVTLGIIAPATAYERTSYVQAYSCKPYLVSTCEVNRCTHQRTGYDSCGNVYCYYVTVVTYRNYYSDGSARTYTRTFRA